LKPWVRLGEQDGPRRHFAFDYALRRPPSASGEIDVCSSTGTVLCIAANRISYCFNCMDPARPWTRTALVAACGPSPPQHLGRRLPAGLPGTNSAGGGGYVSFSRLAMLSPDGRCHNFDAQANSYSRAAPAWCCSSRWPGRGRRDICAVIRATAWPGQPHGHHRPASRQAAWCGACRRPTFPGGIQYVEAHGTGTLVGDPIEARALGEVLGVGRPADRPCLIGSVKTNLGHLEACAGIAGLVKVALALQHREVPANLHFSEPNPEIPFEQLRLRVPVTPEPLVDNGTPALAGINSFGFGGSNAHIILQAPPPAVESCAATPQPGDTGRAELVPLSARSPEALKAMARSLHEFLGAGGSAASLADLCFSTAVRRTHHDWRLALVTHSREELAEQLRTFAAGRRSPAPPPTAPPRSRTSWPGCSPGRGRSGGPWAGNCSPRSRSSAPWSSAATSWSARWANGLCSRS
jgi:acyl transferase domain-containing protein